MWNSIKAQVDGEADISLSAGNTGVLFVISKMILKMMNQVSKPALAGLWPSKKGMSVVLDLGANIECDEKNLIDFWCAYPIGCVNIIGWFDNLSFIN